jgi:hypothetical protein
MKRYESVYHRPILMKENGKNHRPTSCLLKIWKKIKWMRLYIYNSDLVRNALC